MTVDKRIKDAIESINKKGEYIHKDVPSANVRFDEKFAPLDFYFLYQSYFFIAKAMYNALYIKEKEILSMIYVVQGIILSLHITINN